jgi:hypothetical protein
VHFGLALTIVVALALAGCGEDEVVTVTDQETVVQEAPADTGSDRPARRERQDPKPAPRPAEKPAVEEEPASGSIEVPNVVGRDHQLAQDTMQAAGLYLLDEQDCTGQDRALLWDRNWTVVEQDPPAGTVVDEDTEITLCSKKDGE